MKVRWLTVPFGVAMQYRNKIDTCALCGVVTELCNSHIIPEHFYKPMYDGMHRYTVFDNRREKKFPAQHGMKERMLCRACENRTERADDYAKDFFDGRNLTKQGGGKVFSVSGIDYRLLKLFALSLVFRASASRNHFFRKINLGPHHETIRKMVLIGDVGQFDKFPVSVHLITCHKNIDPQSKIMVEPDTIRYGDAKACRFLFGGFMWLVRASERPVSSTFRDAFLKDNGTMNMLAITVNELEVTGQMVRAVKSWSAKHG